MLPPLSRPQSPCGATAGPAGVRVEAVGPRWGWGCHEPSPWPAAVQGLWSLSSLVETTPGLLQRPRSVPGKRPGSARPTESPEKATASPSLLLRAQLCPL